jgi:hypothetical protein
LLRCSTTTGGPPFHERSQAIATLLDDHRWPTVPRAIAPG